MISHGVFKGGTMFCTCLSISWNEHASGSAATSKHLHVADHICGEANFAEKAHGCTTRAKCQT